MVLISQDNGVKAGKGLPPLVRGSVYQQDLPQAYPLRCACASINHIIGGAKIKPERRQHV